MPKKAMDLQAIRQAEERLKTLLAAHPELRDPARQEALADWLSTFDQEDTPMAKKGRPVKYQAEDEAPVTVSVRMPRELYDQAQRYVRMRPHMTLTELVLDGLRLRLETPADPRDLILSDNNTVIQELQAMIQAAVQAEVGKVRAAMAPSAAPEGQQSAHPPSAPSAELEGSPPLAEAQEESIPLPSLNGNTVIQETVLPFDATRYELGALCRNLHDFDGRGHSLRQKAGKRECLACTRARNARHQQRLCDATAAH